MARRDIVCPLCGADCPPRAADCWMCKRRLPPLIGKEMPIGERREEPVDRPSERQAKGDTAVSRALLVEVLILIAFGGLYTGIGKWLYLLPLLLVPLIFLEEPGTTAPPETSAEPAPAPEGRPEPGILETLGYVLGAIALVIGIVFVGGLVLLFIVCGGLAIR